MRAVSVSIGGLQSLIPSFSLVSAADEATMPCGGKICHPVTEYCSKASEVCQLCTTICDNTTHNYDHLILLLVTVLLVLIALRCAYQCLRWLIGNRCFQKLLRRLQSKAYPHPATANGKDLNATTIQNLNAINRHGSDLERAQSHIYSVAEGSVVTMTTPVSTRYPAENSTTPTTVMTEIGYGYDNQAMVVTPVTEKPSTATVAAAF
ncbi:hypothetical protein M5D96_004769 [Drosophila gunungcola]|uniref:Protein grindelwald n=1 Tax=Drosophila gunungcola TaxID=103775 RepID=A0A9P9YUQ4_9MUSC|nr:hypothetical protein M5D96_004769 [Drosophila gunungcola]